MYDAISLSNLLISNGLAPRLAKRLGGILFAEADPLPQAGRPGEPTHPDTPCLTWRGGMDSSGYGTVSGRWLIQHVHQVTFAESGGIVPVGLVLGHMCERRPCGHPDHVRPITRQQNAREGGGRSYPDQLLMLAPEVECGWCDGPTTVSIQLYSNRPPSWLWTCSPCYERHCRARKTTGSAKGIPSGRRALRVSGPALDLLAA